MPPYSAAKVKAGRILVKIQVPKGEKWQYTDQITVIGQYNFKT